MKERNSEIERERKSEKARERKSLFLKIHLRADTDSGLELPHEEFNL